MERVFRTFVYKKKRIFAVSRLIKRLITDEITNYLLKYCRKA